MRFNYFVPNNFQQFVDNCFKIFDSGEPGLFLFPPKTDGQRRVDQLIQDCGRNFPLLKLDISEQFIEDKDDLLYYLKRREKYEKKGKIGIFVFGLEKAISENNFSLIDQIVRLTNFNPKLRFLFFSETDLTHPQIASQFSQTHIFSNLFYYPLYDKENTFLFIDYLYQKWGMRVEEKQKNLIYKNCGGHFWLVKQAVRVSRNNSKLNIEEIFASDAMQFRLEQIYLSFLENEQQVLKKVIGKEKVKDLLEKHSLIHLEKLGIIKKGKLTIPILENYIQQNLPKINIKLINNRIFINDVLIDNYFSKNERRVFKTLLLKKNQIITRDQIAKAIWPINTEQHYSDWAVDRIIFRLREKLKQLSLAKEIIKTIRSQGYIFTQ